MTTKTDKLLLLVSQGAWINVIATNSSFVVSPSDELEASTLSCVGAQGTICELSRPSLGIESNHGRGLAHAVWDTCRTRNTTEPGFLAPCTELHLRGTVDLDTAVAVFLLEIQFRLDQQLNEQGVECLLGYVGLFLQGKLRLQHHVTPYSLVLALIDAAFTKTRPFSLQAKKAVACEFFEVVNQLLRALVDRAIDEPGLDMDTALTLSSERIYSLYSHALTQKALSTLARWDLSYGELLRHATTMSVRIGGCDSPIDVIFVENGELSHSTVQELFWRNGSCMVVSSTRVATIPDRYSVEFALPRDAPHHLIGLCILLDREDATRRFDTHSSSEIDSLSPSPAVWNVKDDRHYHRVASAAEGTTLNLDDLRAILSDGPDLPESMPALIAQHLRASDYVPVGLDVYGHDSGDLIELMMRGGHEHQIHVCSILHHEPRRLTEVIKTYHDIFYPSSIGFYLSTATTINWRLLLDVETLQLRPEDLRYIVADPHRHIITQLLLALREDDVSTAINKAEHIKKVCDPELEVTLGCLEVLDFLRQKPALLNDVIDPLEVYLVRVWESIFAPGRPYRDWIFDLYSLSPLVRYFSAHPHLSRYIGVALIGIDEFSDDIRALIARAFQADASRLITEERQGTIAKYAGALVDTPWCFAFHHAQWSQGALGEPSAFATVRVLLEPEHWDQSNWESKLHLGVGALREDLDRYGLLGPAILAFVAIEATRRIGRIYTHDTTLKSHHMHDRYLLMSEQFRSLFFEGLDGCSSDHKLSEILLSQFLAVNPRWLLRDKDGIATKYFMTLSAGSWRLSRYLTPTFLALDSVERQLAFLRRVLLYPNAAELFLNMQRALGNTTNALTISYFSMLLFEQKYSFNQLSAQPMPLVRQVLEQIYIQYPDLDLVTQCRIVHTLGKIKTLNPPDIQAATQLLADLANQDMIPRHLRSELFRYSQRLSTIQGLLELPDSPGIFHLAGLLAVKCWELFHGNPTYYSAVQEWNQVMSSSLSEATDLSRESRELLLEFKNQVITAFGLAEAIAKEDLEHIASQANGILDSCLALQDRHMQNPDFAVVREMLAQLHSWAWQLVSVSSNMLKATDERTSLGLDLWMSRFLKLQVEREFLDFTVQRVKNHAGIVNSLREMGEFRSSDELVLDEDTTVILNTHTRLRKKWYDAAMVSSSQVWTVQNQTETDFLVKTRDALARTSGQAREKALVTHFDETLNTLAEGSPRLNSTDSWLTRWTKKFAKSNGNHTRPEPLDTNEAHIFAPPSQMGLLTYTMRNNLVGRAIHGVMNRYDFPTAETFILAHSDTESRPSWFFQLLTYKSSLIFPVYFFSCFILYTLWLQNAGTRGTSITKMDSLFTILLCVLPGIFGLVMATTGVLRVIRRAMIRPRKRLYKVSQALVYTDLLLPGYLIPISFGVVTACLMQLDYQVWTSMKNQHLLLIPLLLFLSALGLYRRVSVSAARRHLQITADIFAMLWSQSVMIALLISFFFSGLLASVPGECSQPSSGSLIAWCVPVVTGFQLAFYPMLSLMFSSVGLFFATFVDGVLRANNKGLKADEH